MLASSFGARPILSGLAQAARLNDYASSQLHTTHHGRFVWRPPSVALSLQAKRHKSWACAELARRLCSKLHPRALEGSDPIYENSVHAFSGYLDLSRLLLSLLGHFRLRCLTAARGC